MNFFRKRKRAALALLLLLLLAGGGWVWSATRADPGVERAKDLRSQLAGEAGRQLSPEQRRERRRQLGEEMRNLSPGQRRELMGDRRKESRERLNRFFK